LGGAPSRTDAATKREVQRQWKEAGAADGREGEDDGEDEGGAAKRLKAEDEAEVEPMEMSMRALTDNAVTAVGTADPVGDFQKMVARRDQDLVTTGTRQRKPTGASSRRFV